jgi:methanogenic corrinoid protein MtbC1
MVADVLESGGWDVRFLVTQLPHAGILDAVEEHDADLLGISVTMVCNLPQVSRLLADLRKHFGDKTPRILVGGAAFRDAPMLWEELGASGCGRKLRDALRLAG